MMPALAHSNGDKPTMSNIQNILSALQEAKEAQDMVPDLKAQIRDLQRLLDERTQAVSRLEDDLNSSRSAHASAKDKISSLEVERDSYGFRAIDAEEKLEQILSLVGPKAPPVVSEPEPASPVPADTSPANAPVANVATGGNSEAPVEPVTAATVTPTPAVVYSADVGVPTSVPMDPPTASTSPNPSPTVPSSTASDTPAASMPEPTPPKPYADQRYWEKPDTISWADWRQGGGQMPPYAVGA